jgi:putative endopeptidase
VNPVLSRLRGFNLNKAVLLSPTLLLLLSATPFAPVSATVNAAMDRTVDPCTDFYTYACGGWLKTEKRPADQVEWVRSFSVIDERNLAELRLILEDAAAGKPTPSGRTDDREWARLGTFYSACMDEGAAEEAGPAPMHEQLELVANVRNLESLMVAAGTLGLEGVNVFFSTYVTADNKNPSLEIMTFAQGGLGLPDRDYYVGRGGKGLDDEGKKLLAAYQAHVSKMLSLAGEKDAKKTAKKIVAFETELAKIAQERDQLRDPETTYHKEDMAGLQRRTPELPWQAWLSASGIPDKKDASIEYPPFFDDLGKLLPKTDLETLRAYMRWHVIDAGASRLSHAFVDADFDFYGKVLSGQEEIRPRWKRCVSATDGSLGELLGRYYVERDFPGQSRQVAVDMIASIEKAFADGLAKVGWMDEPTRAVATEKVHAVDNMIGFPDKWRDYSSVEVRKGAYFANSLAAMRFEAHRQFAKVGGPVDKKEWGMTPSTVNAYYDPSMNQMVFPAGILQAPFFDLHLPMAMNFGGIGMVMAHELTHGFDDQGRKFDKAGRQVTWWPEVVGKAFEEKARCVTSQYDAYEIQPGIHVNGTLTTGENIADIGGIKESFRAWKAWTAAHPDEAATPVVENLTNDQLFFVGFAQAWCTLATPEFEKMMVTINPHSPPRFRVEGPLRDSPDFAEAFQCKAGSPMAPTNACTVW